MNEPYLSLMYESCHKTAVIINNAKHLLTILTRKTVCCKIVMKYHMNYIFHQSEASYDSIIYYLRPSN